jgi:hypothetical protein
MTALAQDRDTPMKHESRTLSCKVAAATTIYKGSIVAFNAGGFLVPGADTAGLATAGIADQHIDNSAGANGDLECVVLKGVAGCRADGTAPTQAEIGRDVMIQDSGNVTTAAAATNNVVAGRLDAINADGLFYVNMENS